VSAQSAPGGPHDGAETREGPWFCVYGHEHGDKKGAVFCDAVWDQSWRGSVCGLHDAGLTMNCTCTPTQSDGVDPAGTMEP
jgi:hypothetical protein